jgi:hypothetical protein
LWVSFENISKKVPDEDRNLIKKGWDHLYRDPMCEEGSLSRRQEKVGKKLTSKQKGKFVIKQSRITSPNMTPSMDLIWTKTTQRTTLKKMS